MEVEREIRTLREQEQLYSAELAELNPYAPIVDESGATLLGPEDQLIVLQRRYLQLSAAYGEDHPDLIKLRREMEAVSSASGLPAFDARSLQTELALRESELTELRNRYSDDHPDVLRLERVVTGLRQRLDDTAPRPAPAASRRRPDNPVYIQRQVMLEGTRSELRAALDRRETLRLRSGSRADAARIPRRAADCAR
jgi:hypothetical protein